MLRQPKLRRRHTVKDGATQLGDVTYRFDGIDAPELDQICIDEHADPWACGVEARDQLTKSDRRPRGALRGPRLSGSVQDAAYRYLHRRGRERQFERPARPPGICLDFEPYCQRPVQGRRGRREGQSPRTLERLLRRAPGIPPGERKDGALLGVSCRTDKDRQRRACCFPTTPSMPPGCSIKGKLALRARLTGKSGRLSFAGMPQLPCPDQTGSLVLLRGRRAGRRLPQGLQLRSNRQEANVTNLS